MENHNITNLEQQNISILSFFSLDNKWFIWPLFLFLMTYCILRAWFVQPMLDELGTFYGYIQSGKILGKDAIIDANNHLINSYFGNLMLRLFGDHFFGYRLLSVFSLGVYFFATRYYISRTVDKQVAWVVFLAMNSIPWIFEYFGFSRGYGLSLALFFSSFCYLYQWKESKKARHFTILLILLVIGCVSNLSLTIPVLLLFGYSFLILCFDWKNIENKRGHLIAFFIFIASMTAVYSHLQKLKAHGALWWGSTDGLWEVTGKSLLKNVLFTEAEYWKYILLGIFAFTVILAAIYFRKQTFRQIFRSEIFMVAGVFSACLLAAVFMAAFMQINYPMDRVGMHLVPLFILTLGLIYSKFPRLKWLLLFLVYFPVSLVLKMNLNTSIFSPGDRIQPAFLERLNAVTTPETVISADYVSHQSYAYLVRKQPVQHLASEYTNDSMALGDYHISWIDELHFPNYTCIYRDPLAGTRLYKRVHPPLKKIVLDTVITQVSGTGIEIPVLIIPLQENWRNQQLELHVSGKMSISKPTLKVNFVELLCGANGETTKSQTIRFDWYFGKKTDYSFRFPNRGFFPSEKDKKIRLLLLNGDYVPLKLKQIKIQLYTLSGN